MANFDPNALYPEYYVIKNIQNLRKNNIPQLIILHQNDHWTTWIITREGIWGTNSLKNYDTEGINQTLIRIFNYFNYHQLPSFESISPLIRWLRKVREEVDQIKQSALQQDFTPAQFEELAQKHRHRSPQDGDDVEKV